MSKMISFRPTEGITSYIDTVAKELGINKSKAILLLLDLSESSFTMDNIETHYNYTKYDLIKKEMELMRKVCKNMTCLNARKER